MASPSGLCHTYGRPSGVVAMSLLNRQFFLDSLA
jgi:hypothetical protein